MQQVDQAARSTQSRCSQNERQNHPRRQHVTWERIVSLLGEAFPKVGWVKEVMIVDNGCQKRVCRGNASVEALSSHASRRAERVGQTKCPRAAIFARFPH
eukprot:scaffold31956_cov78-Skeletonema_dohrnii-CCMP3373.AAC.1